MRPQPKVIGKLPITTSVAGVLHAMTLCNLAAKKPQQRLFHMTSHGVPHDSLNDW